MLSCSLTLFVPSPMLRPNPDDLVSVDVRITPTVNWTDNVQPTEATLTLMAQCTHRRHVIPIGSYEIPTPTPTHPGLQPVLDGSSGPGGTIQFPIPAGTLVGARRFRFHIIKCTYSVTFSDGNTVSGCFPASANLAEAIPDSDPQPLPQLS